jgi:hypothetical protein
MAGCLCAALAGCGGGGGSTSSAAPPPPPDSTQGSFSLGLAAGAATGYSHVYVTISEVAITADADRPWSPTDSAWHVLSLPEPLTIDLVALSNGTVAQLAVGQALPPGTYGQLRLFVVPADAALSTEAKQQQLAYNDEADFIDAGGTAQRVPIEFPDTSLGLRIAGPVTVSANTDNAIILQWDVDHSLVRFDTDGSRALTMRPDLQWYDFNTSGSISGLVDKTQFCAAGTSAANCISDAVASAELVAADGSVERVVRSAPLIDDPNDATRAVFVLYPLPALASGQSFDVVIRGRQMRTMVVTGVPAPAASPLTALQPPTALGADTPLQPQLSAGDGSVTLAQPLPGAGAQLRFVQTLPGATQGLEIAAANVDPFSGLLAQPQALPTGALRVAAYSATQPLAFADVTAQEGDSGYRVITAGRAYDSPSAPVATTATPNGNASVVAAAVSLQPGVANGTLTVALGGGSSASSYDAAELVVSDVNGIVATQDVSSLIGHSGAQAQLAVPAGSGAAALVGTAVYSVALRVWKHSAPTTTVQWVRVAGTVDLRSASSASVSVTLP